MDTKIIREDIDDYSRRNTRKDSYKNRVFDGNRLTQDEYTGKKLFYSKNGVNAAVGQERHYTTETTANVDHVIPIDTMIERYGDKITPEQLKKITNSDYNLAITSEKINKAKGKMSNHEYLYKQFREGNSKSITTTYNMLHREATANIANHSAVTVTAVSNNVGNVLKIDSTSLNKEAENTARTTGRAMQSGTDAALISLTVSSINNLVSVATGEKDLGTAVKDIARDTVTSAVSGAGLQLAQEAVVGVANFAGNTAMVTALQNLPVAQIAVAISVGNSVMRFINDDISAEECVTEILLNGAGILAFNIGMTVGGPAGAIIASVVVGQISKTILEYKQTQKLNAEKERKFNSIVCEALLEMEKQRKNLQQMIAEKYSHWDNSFDNGFKLIYISAIENDIDGITDGLNSILSIFNKNAKFSTIEEFNVFFDNIDAELTL